MYQSLCSTHPSFEDRYRKEDIVAALEGIGHRRSGDEEMDPAVELVVPFYDCLQLLE